MTKEEFIIELNKLNIELNFSQLNQLETYANFLMEYNEHTNLTAIKNKEDIYLKHFYDSITIAKSIDLKNINTLLDIGTGAGFPGMVLKIVYPHLQITLMDSNNKKITFLEELSKKLNIKVTLVKNRAEEYIIHSREYYDVVTSRAVAELPILIELAIPYLKVGGYFLAMKSNYEEEVKKSKSILTTIGASISNITTFKLPKEQSNRTIIQIVKEKVTNPKYPRNYSQIKKNTK